MSKLDDARAGLADALVALVDVLDAAGAPGPALARDARFVMAVDGGSAARDVNIAIDVARAVLSARALARGDAGVLVAAGLVVARAARVSVLLKKKG